MVDTRTYETLYTLRHADYRTVLNWSRACWSPSNGLVAAGSGNSTLMLWGLRVPSSRWILHSTCMAFL